jgi:hypothetical protein
VQFLALGDLYEGQQHSAHFAHDLVHFVEAHLVHGVVDGDHLFLLVLVQFYLFQHVDRVFLFLALQEYLAGDDRVQQVLEVFLRFGSAQEEVLFELFVVFVHVLLVDFGRGEGQLPAVY